MTFVIFMILGYYVRQGKLQFIRVSSLRLRRGQILNGKRGKENRDVIILHFYFMFGYLKSLMKVNSGDSSKSFGLVCSVCVGSFIGIVIGVVLLYDGLLDGTLDTDLWMVGWFLFCDSVFIFGGGLNKTLSEKFFEKGNGRKNEEG